MQSRRFRFDFRREKSFMDQQKMYQQWFNHLDSDGDGRITSDEANRFFAMWNIKNRQLNQVWAIADTKRQGFLGFKEFVTAMQFLSPAQAGHELSLDLVKSTFDAEPPVVKGLDSLLVKHRGSRTNSASERNGILVAQHVPSNNVSPERNGILVTQHVPSNNVSLERNGILVGQDVPPNNVFASRMSKKTSSQISLETHIADGLNSLYKEKLKPLEVAYHYNDFASPLLTDGDFHAKPVVMLLGPCSSGKTTFIKHLLKCEYLGAQIGPEPTTDKFTVIMDGHDKRLVSGNTITFEKDMPFNQLISFGEAFLSKFECSQMPHPLLERVTFVDTPGVLSGEKQRTNRNYDITGVYKWFAEKCDLILLLFDPHNPSISEEFSRVLSSIHGQYEKMCVVLTKADQVDNHQLLRAYGTLTWLLAKYTPEVPRAYIGSFNDKPINEALVGFTGKILFEKEQDDLLKRLIGLPKEACSRRVNNLYKRARAVKMHAYILNQLRLQMPLKDMWGKSYNQWKLLEDLENVFAKVQMEFHLPACNFPDVDHFRQVVSAYKVDKFEVLKPSMIQAVDDMLQFDIPKLLKHRN